MNRSCYRGRGAEEGCKGAQDSTALTSPGPYKTIEPPRVVEVGLVEGRSSLHLPGLHKTIWERFMLRRSGRFPARSGLHKTKLKGQCG